MKNKDILNFSTEYKFKIYLNYYIKQWALIYDPLIFDLNTRFEINKNAKIYPNLGIYTLSSGQNKEYIRSFEDFCNEKDDRVSGGLLGYYRRFNKEI